MLHARLGTVLGIGVALVAFAARARADEPPVCGTADAEGRLAFVRREMRGEANRVALWSTTWAFTGTALAIGNFTRATVSPNADARVDATVSGVTSVFIPVSLVVMPRRILRDEAALAALPDDACTTLAHAEALLAASADDEAFGTGAVAHAVNVGGNVGVALFLGLAFGHWKSGIVAAVGGIALGEVQIWTQPTGAVQTLAAYRSGVVAARTAPPWTVRLAPLPVEAARGLAIELGF